MSWVEEVKDLKKEDAIFILVGNKTDLTDQRYLVELLSYREVSKEEGEALAREKGYTFEEVSAKTGANIQQLFYQDVFNQIAKKYNLVSNENSNDNNGNFSYIYYLENKSVKLDQTSKKGKKKCCK